MSLITSENQTVCFPSFVLTVFWRTTSYTVIIVLWKTLLEPVNSHARWWPCACLKCGSGLRSLEETMDFFKCIHVLDLVLKYGWHKLRKLVTASLLLHCIDGYSCLRCWNELFFSCVSGFRLKFSRIALWRKRLQLASKSNLTTNELILRFFVGKWLLSLTSYLYRLKSARVACCSFLTTSFVAKQTADRHTAKFSLV